ncbi:MAG: PHB depolymerase family esterase [Anaerolineae bacterium]
MRSRLLDAARLKRTRQFLEATAAVQRTLREVLKPAEETVVEGTCHVVEPVAKETAGQESPLPQVEVTILTRPLQNRDEAAQPSTPPSSVPVMTIPPESAASPAETSPIIAGLAIPFQLPPQFRWPEDKVSEPPPVAEPSDTQQPEQGQGRFISASYTNQAGTRSYKLYLPGAYQGQAWPLVVMLHGCTQSPDDFATATRMNELAEAGSFLVAYPAQTFKANLGKCWNWFKASEQQRGRGEPAIIAGLTRHIVKTYGVDPARVYVAGISAGGAMAMVMGMTYPDLYTAVGIQSGVPYGVAHNLLSGLIAIKGGGTISTERLRSAPGAQTRPRMVPTIVFHGDQDGIVYPDNSAQIIAQWLELRIAEGAQGPAPQVKVYQGQVPAGHAYTRSVYHAEDGTPLMEQWLVHGAGHAWSGGNPNVAWTDAKGPDASREMLRFFYEHARPHDV